jgi:PAS domain S-box-containing protein
VLSLKRRNKQGEEGLRNFAARLKILYDESFEAVLLSENGICIYQNPTAERLFGYSLPEALVRHEFEWIVPEDRELVKNKLLLKYSAPFEVTGLRKDGTVFPCEIRTRNINCSGRSTRIAFLRDITERKRIAKEKENLQAKLTHAIEIAHLGPWEYDVIQDRFLFNDEFYKMFRTTAEQVGGYTMTSDEYARRFVHPDEIAIVGDEIRKVIETNDPNYNRELVHRIVYADGKVGHIIVRIFIQKDANGKTIKTFGVNQDITQRKQYEQTLKELNEELARRTALAEARAKQLQTLTVELIQAEDRERQRIAGLLHGDLQQMLAYLKLKFNTLKVDKAEANNQSIDAINNHIDKCIERCRNLSHELKPYVFQKKNFITALEWVCRQMKAHYGLEVSLETTVDLEIFSSVLTSLLIRSIKELLFNVVKHSGEKKAWIKLKVEDRQMLITIKDSGIGCDPGELKAKRDSHAAFGLFDIEDRVNFLGGYMDVETKPDHGFCVTLWIPRDLNCQAENRRPMPEVDIGAAFMANQLTDEPPISSGERSISVLLADDHTIMRDGLAELISGHAGIHVVGMAANGQEAVALAAKVKPHIVLMDVSMPVMNGIDATRRIKESFPEMRIIGLTMHKDPDVHQAMINAGACACLSKSGFPNKLVETIRSFFSDGESFLSDG